MAKARDLLTQAETMLSVGLYDAAGRTAYLAAFNVAQAFIFEDRAKVAKTHSGVQSEFARLVKGDSRADLELQPFLAQTYNLKQIADYDTGPEAAVSPERAMRAVATAHRFVDHFVALLAQGPHVADRR